MYTTYVVHGIRSRLAQLFQHKTQTEHRLLNESKSESNTKGERKRTNFIQLVSTWTSPVLDRSILSLIALAFERYFLFRCVPQTISIVEWANDRRKWNSCVCVSNGIRERKETQNRIKCVDVVSWTIWIVHILPLNKWTKSKRVLCYTFTSLIIILYARTPVCVWVW